jgi:ribokinase
MGVLVFGSVVADLVFALPSLPRPGHTVLGPGYRTLPGGKGANQATAAALDGAAAAFAGAVGADAMAEIALSAMRAAGVDLSRLAVVEAPTACAAVCVGPDGQNQIAVGSGANRLAQAAQVEPAALGPGSVLLLQMEVPAEENAALIARARAAGTRVLLNLAPATPLPRAALGALDLLIANEHEAAALGAALGCAGSAAALHAALGIAVAVTLGEAGAEAMTAEGALTVPAFPVLAVDTTGAGDAWCGVLAAGLDRGLPLALAMRRASAAAALACTRVGAAAALPGRAAIEALL